MSADASTPLTKRRSSKRRRAESERLADIESLGAIPSQLTLIFDAIALDDEYELERLIGARGFESNQSVGDQCVISVAEGSAKVLLVLSDVSPLIFAVIAGAEDSVSVLLRQGADPNYRVSEAAFAFSTLFWGMKLGRVGLCRRLLAGGAKVDAFNATPALLPLTLHCALPPWLPCRLLHQAQDEAPALLRLLLQHGLDPNAALPAAPSRLIRLARLLKPADRPAVLRLFLRAGYRLGFPEGVVIASLKGSPEAAQVAISVEIGEALAMGEGVPSLLRVAAAAVRRSSHLGPLIRAHDASLLGFIPNFLREEILLA